jgi:fumarylacetoacetate (FAA) hydrolase family protein
MTELHETIAPALPQDGFTGALAGRVWRPEVQGPSVVAIRADGVFDISKTFATMRDLCESPDPVAALRAARGDNLGALDSILANTPRDQRDPNKPWLLTPIDLQAVKAAGVTFPISMLERVIEERARGNIAAAPKSSA